MVSQMDLVRIRTFLDQLQEDDPERRLLAAQELRQVGLGYRPAPGVRTRGSIGRPASALVTDEDQKRLARAVADPNCLVRREMALAIGQFCDDLAVDQLIRMARFDADGRVREAVAEALILIGGGRASKALGEMARTDPSLPVVTRAAEGLEVLLQTANEPPATGQVRTRGGSVVRMRGAARPTPIPTSPEVADALEALDELRHHPNPMIRQTVDGARWTKGSVAE